MKLVLYLIIGFFVFLTGQTMGEHVAINREIEAFKKKGVFQESISTDTVKYYKVSRETYYPNEIVRDPFFLGDLNRPGSSGDIFVTQQSPLVGYAGIHQFVSFFFGGHAAMLDENNKIFETVGIPDDDERLLDVMINGGRNTHVVGGVYNYWLDNDYRSVSETDPSYVAYGTYYRNEWIGLRVKGATNDDIVGALDYLKDLEEKEAQYNFWFVLNTKNKYYCTDLVSRAYESLRTDEGDQKYKFNRDGIAVTVNDLVLSKNTYISYYVTTKNNIKYVYYIA